MIQFLTCPAKSTPRRVNFGIEFGEKAVVHIELFIDLQRDMMLSVDGVG